MRFLFKICSINIFALFFYNLRSILYFWQECSLAWTGLNWSVDCIVSKTELDWTCTGLNWIYTVDGTELGWIYTLNSIGLADSGLHWTELDLHSWLHWTGLNCTMDFVVWEINIFSILALNPGSDPNRPGD